jgi:hypothetical protein
MTLLAPLWLVLILPWAGLAVWMLRARGRDVEVPFVRLWRTGERTPSSARGRRLPPLYVLLVLLALLGLILAASQPMVSAGSRSATKFILILDRGNTTSARALADLRDDLRDFDSAAAELRLVPGDPAGTAPIHSLSDIADIALTAVDTRQLIDHAVRDALSEHDAPVLVFTGHALEIQHARVIQIPPGRAPVNVGIQQVAFRPSPRPQVMLRVFNQSDLTSASLRVAGMEPRAIALPATSQSRDYFIDPPASTTQDVLHVQLEVADELPLDNDAWLAREPAPSRIVVAGNVSPASQRMLRIYSDLRQIQISAEGASLATTPGIELAGNLSSTAAGELQVTPHPVTANIDWRRLTTGDLRITGDSPDREAGWQPVVRVGERVVLAVHEARKQVWVGFDFDSFAADPAFVVLWTNMLDHITGGEARWVARTPQTLPPGWQRIMPGPLPAGVQAGRVPGIYRSAENQQRAINAPARLVPDPPRIDWRSELTDLFQSRQAGVRFSPALVTAALMLLALALLLWPGARR